MRETVVNIENLNKLINHLNDINKINFSMNNWIFPSDMDRAYSFVGKPTQELVTHMESGRGDCGTVACIAGHASLLSGAENNRSYFLRGSAVKYDAMEWLGLDEKLADRLFMPPTKWFRATPRKAIAVLENLRETALRGQPKIDWSTKVGG